MDKRTKQKLMSTSQQQKLFKANIKNTQKKGLTIDLHSVFVNEN